MSTRDAGDGSLCLVANELDFLDRTGGIGTYNWLLAHLLAGHGWNVHILYSGPSWGSALDPEKLAEVRAGLGAAGIALAVLDDFRPLAHLNAPPAWPAAVYQSDRIRHALVDWHRQTHFDLIEFPEFDGPGFRSVQARRAGLELLDVPILVKLHGSLQWSRQANHLWLQGVEDLLREFGEQDSFEHADFQVAPSRAHLDAVRRNGWRVRPDAQVVPNPFPEPRMRAQGPSAGIPELVFFGRLEQRKGLGLFLEAAQHLDPAWPLTFLGRDTRLADGTPGSELVRKRLPGRTAHVITDWNREEALAYLTEGNRLAVMPALEDNYPNTVIECAVHGIPFLASNVGGIPEIISDPELQSRLLFAPNAAGLTRCLKEYLGAAADLRRAWSQRVRAATDVPTHNRQVADFYAGCLAQARTTAAGTVDMRVPSQPPRLTIAVTHYNLGAYLPDALAALATQSYSNLEVLVIDDGSTDPEAQRVFSEQAERYRQFRFVRQTNQGVAAARNRLLAEASGAYFLPVDGDDIATPQLGARLVAALDRNPDLAAMSCYKMDFEGMAEPLDAAVIGADRPLGGPHVAGCLFNTYGHATAIFRTATLRCLGGYDPDPDNGEEDWHLFVKLVSAGHRIGVVPAYLLYCRQRSGSRFRTIDRFLSRSHILQHFLHTSGFGPVEWKTLWTLLASLYHQNERLNHDYWKLRTEHLELLRRREECAKV